MFKNIRLINASYNGDLGKVRRLLENGANIEAKDNGGMTPLFIASINGHENIVKLLLEKDAVIESKDKYGNTSLHFASKYGHEDIVKLLIRKGANIEAPNNNGWTPLHQASRNAHDDAVKFLLKSGANVYAQDNNGKTPLHWASRSGYENVVKSLVQKGANPNIPDDNDQTPLQVAEERNKQKCVLAMKIGSIEQSQAAQEEEEVKQRSEQARHKEMQLDGANAEMYGETKLKRQEGAKLSHDYDNIREQLRLVIERKRHDPVEVTSSYIDEIITGDTLGEGYFGVAYKGFDRVLGKAFALKKIFENAPSARIRGIQDSFQNEMNIVGKLDHPNIARLYGFYSDPNNFERTCLIYELAANGSLEGFWEEEAQCQRLCAGVTRIRIAYQVARALQYMHEGLDGQAVCFHCDIKSANVCLASDFTVRIIDCGLSKYIEKMDERLPSTGLVGTVGYIAPDYSDGSIRYDSSCDVFAFGVFLCELITGTTSPSGERGHFVVFEKTKMKVLSDCLDTCVEWDGSTEERLVELAQKCIKPSMEDRPLIGDVVKTLHQLLYLGCKTKEESVGAHGVSKGRNVITVLYSEPLVYNDWYGNMGTFAKLDVDMERAILKQCLMEAHRDIDLFFDSATDLRLLAARIQRPICLHYSGHGAEMYLPFENGRGAPGRALWLEARELRDLITRDEGQPFKLVFVSACYSQNAGEVFVAAGVPHVVCCEQKSEIKDVAARNFTYQFYHALAAGDTVKFSFEQGCMAVTKEERTNFLLLPEGEDHDVSIFDANEVQEWSPRSKLSDNLIQEELSYRPPQPFLGREIDMYRVLNLILTKQLVSVVGEKGIGRKSLAYAICHYINERRSTMLPTIDSIVFATGSSNRFLRVIQKLEKQLVVLGGETASDVGNDTDSLIDSVCDKISEKALLVIDGTDFSKGSLDQDDLVMFLRRLREMRRTKVLLIGLEPLQHPALPEQDYSLMPLDYDNTIRLFCYLCPRLDTATKRKNYREKIVTAVNEWSCEGVKTRMESLYEALGGGVPDKIMEKAGREMSQTEIDGILSMRLKE